jgi:hypothetical protein
VLTIRVLSVEFRFQPKFPKLNIPKSKQVYLFSIAQAQDLWTMSFTSKDLFLDFLINHDPNRVARHFRIAFLDFIAYNLDKGLPQDFDEYLSEFYDLFGILDASVDETKNK